MKLKGKLKLPAMLLAFAIVACTAIGFSPVKAMVYGSPSISWKSVSQTINSSNVYVYDGSKTDSTMTNAVLSKPSAGVWGYVNRGKVDTSVSGVYSNTNGFWRIENGWSCSMQEKYDAAPESFTTLLFVCSLPEGYVTDPDNDDIQMPTISLSVADPYGVATLATETGYLTKGEKIYYGGYNTHYYKWNDTEAYCANPSASSPSDGYYTATSITNESIAACVWFCYGGPGFQSEMWPAKWYDGSSAQTVERWRALSHIVISDVYAGDAYYAYGQTTAAFQTWCETYITGYDMDTGAIVNSNAIRVNLESKGFAATGDANVWPAGFTVWEITTGTGTQVMLSHEYDESKEHPVYQTVYYKAGTSTDPGSVHQQSGLRYGRDAGRRGVYHLPGRYKAGNSNDQFQRRRSIPLARVDAIHCLLYR